MQLESRRKSQTVPNAARWRAAHLGPNRSKSAARRRAAFLTVCDFRRDSNCMLGVGRHESKVRASNSVVVSSNSQLFSQSDQAAPACAPSVNKMRFWCEYVRAAAPSAQDRWPRMRGGGWGAWETPGRLDGHLEGIPVRCTMGLGLVSKLGGRGSMILCHGEP